MMMEERERKKYFHAGEVVGKGEVGSIDVDVLRRTRVLETMESFSGGENQNALNTFGRDLLEFAKENDVLGKVRTAHFDRYYFYLSQTSDTSIFNIVYFWLNSFVNFYWIISRTVH